MSGYRNKFSKIQFMWIFAMFDLPTLSKEERREANSFRKFLLSEGFSKLQLSVYAKFCGSRVHAEKYVRHIETHLPCGGQVRTLCVTDKQFGDMCIFYRNKGRPKPETPPEQMMLL